MYFMYDPAWREEVKAALRESLEALGCPRGAVLLREGERFVPPITAGLRRGENLQRLLGIREDTGLWQALQASARRPPPAAGGWMVLPLRRGRQTVGLLALGFGRRSAPGREPARAAARSISRHLDLLFSLARMQRNYLNTILVLLRTIEAKDRLTRGHSDRVAEYCLKTGTALGLSQERMNVLSWAALLHDIGKVGIVDAILQKKGSLTDEETVIVREHPVIGERIVQDLDQLCEAAPVIRHHHERWDGKGYPDGLAGERIPYLARILALGEVFDTVVSPTPYKEGQPVEEAARVLRGEKGRMFDPDLVDLFLEAILF